jgi:hypothetical protein
LAGVTSTPNMDPALLTTCIPDPRVLPGPLLPPGLSGVEMEVEVAM